MRARRAGSALTTGLSMVVALSLTACSGEEPKADEPQQTQSASPAPEPPSISETMGLVTGWGPTREELDTAAREARRMPLGDLAGQVIIADYSGTAAPVRMVRSLHLGGVIAFSANAPTMEAVEAANRTLVRKVRRPLWVGVDQEGGIVERVKGDLTRFPAFMATGAAGDPDLTRAAYQAGGAELRSLGFTIDFAPTADVTIGAADPAIGSRSASDDPEEVARESVAAAQGFLDAGVTPVLKHFPGHGSVTSDSHRTLPLQTKSLKELTTSDLVPFQAGIDAGLPVVMVGHLAVPALEKGMPTSLSRAAVTGLLRRQMGFGGLVVTDALDMRAVSARFSSADSAVRAIRAGVDVLLMPPDPAAARAGLIKAVRTKTLDRARLEQAVARSLALQAHQSTSDGARPGSAQKAADELSRAAITNVSGDCEGRLVGDDLIPVGDPVAVANFKAAAARAGLGLGQIIHQPVPDKVVKEKVPQPPRKIVKWVGKGKKRKKVVTYEPRPPKTVTRSIPQPDRIIYDGTVMSLVGYGGGTPSSSIVIATDTPYVLARTSAEVKLATFGNTPAAMAALVDVLLGEAKATGRLPVKVDGVPRGCE